MELSALDLVLAYKLLLLCAAVPTFVAAVRQARLVVVRYRGLPPSLQRAVLSGAKSGGKAVFENDRSKLLRLIGLLMLLLSLTIASWLL